MTTKRGIATSAKGGRCTSTDRASWEVRSMTDNDSSAEKRTGAGRLNYPMTTLRFEGIEPDELPQRVLTDLLDVCQDADLPVHSISIHREDHQW